MMQTNRNISKRLWIGALTAANLGGLLMVAPSWAQPDVNNAPKADNPANRAVGKAKGKGKRDKGANRDAMMKQLQDDELTQLATATGKTFTDDEKQKIRDAMAIRQNSIQAAQQKYVTDLALATGLEADDLQMKLRQVRANRAQRMGDAMQKRGKGNRRNRADAAPAAPAAAPAAATAAK